MENCTVAAEGCKRLFGDLDLCAVSLTSLEVVEGKVFCEANLEFSAFFPALLSIEGDFVLHNTSLRNVSLPVLDSVAGILSVRNNVFLQSLAFPSLRNVSNGVFLANNDALTEVQLSQLAFVGGDLMLKSNSALVEISLGALSEVKGKLSIDHNANLINFFAPVVKFVNALHLVRTPALLRFDLPSLSSVQNSITCADNLALQDFELPSLDTSIVDLFIDGNIVLTRVTLHVSKMSGSFECANNTLLTNVTMHDLTSINGTLALTNNSALENFDMATLKVVRENVVILQNARLLVLTLPLEEPVQLLVVQENTALRTLSMDLLPSIVSVFAVDLNFDLTSVSFEQLASVGLRFDLRDNPKLGTIRFRSLLSIGNIVISNCSVLTSVSMPLLTSITSYFRLTDNNQLSDLAMEKLRSIGESVTIRNNPQLPALDLTALDKVGSLFEVVNNVKLISISLDKLTTVRDALQILSNPMLRNIRLPILKTVDALDISGNLYLDDLIIDKLATISDFLQLLDNPALETVTFVSLTTIGNNFRIANNPVLNSVVVPELKTIGRQFEIIDNTMLNTLSVPRLTSIGRYLEFKKLEMNHISMPLLTTIADYLFLEGNVNSVDMFSLRKIGSSRKFQLSWNLNVAACWSLIKNSSGWENVLIDPRTPDVCLQSAQVRVARGARNMTCTRRDNCTWENLGCFPSLTASGGHLDCSALNMKGSFAIQNVDWTGLPSFMPNLASIDFANNSITDVRRGATTCGDGMKFLSMVSFRSNPELSFVHAQYAQYCPSLRLEHDLRECRHASDPDMTLVLDPTRATRVCRCANGTYCTDEGLVMRCSTQEYLAYNACLACPYGSTSPIKAISPAQCVREGQAIDALGIGLSVTFAAIALIYVVLVKVKFEKQFRRIAGIKPWAPLVALLSTYDFLTDCLFFAQSSRGDHQSITYLCGVFLLLPIMLNLMLLIALFVYEFATRPEIEDESNDFQLWFSKSNRGFVSVMLLLGVTNPGVITLLESHLFGLVTLSAPFKAKTFLKLHPVVNNIAEDIPQLVIQIYSLSLQSNFSIVTVLSVCTSIMALLTGLVSKTLFGCMISIRNDRSGSVAMQQQRHLSTKLLSPADEAEAKQEMAAIA